MRRGASTRDISANGLRSDRLLRALVCRRMGEHRLSGFSTNILLVDGSRHVAVWAFAHVEAWRTDLG